MPVRENLDGRDDALQESTSKIPLILLSLASDPENVTVLPRPISKENAELVIKEMFNLNTSAFKDLTIKRSTVTSHGRTVWANIPAEYWSTVVRDGDELRVFTIMESADATKPTQWEDIPATIVYDNYVRVLLLSDTYKETTERIFSRVKYKLPSNTTIKNIRLRLLINDPLLSDGDSTAASFHQSRYDSDDDWRAILARLHRDRGSLTIRVICLTQ